MKTNTNLRAYCLQIVGRGGGRYDLTFAAPVGVCGEPEDELWRACNRLHDRTQEWELRSAEKAGAGARIDFVLTVPAAVFEHAIGCMALAVVECRRERVFTAALSRLAL